VPDDPNTESARPRDRADLDVWVRRALIVATVAAVGGWLARCWSRSTAQVRATRQPPGLGPGLVVVPAVQRRVAGANIGHRPSRRPKRSCGRTSPRAGTRTHGDRYRVGPCSWNQQPRAQGAAPMVREGHIQPSERVPSYRFGTVHGSAGGRAGARRRAGWERFECAGRGGVAGVASEALFAAIVAGGGSCQRNQRHSAQPAPSTASSGMGRQQPQPPTETSEPRRVRVE
jgi:hypothetical protein